MLPIARASSIAAARRRATGRRGRSRAPRRRPSRSPTDASACAASTANAAGITCTPLRPVSGCASTARRPRAAPGDPRSAARRSRACARARGACAGAPARRGGRRERLASGGPLGRPARAVAPIAGTPPGSAGRAARGVARCLLRVRELLVGGMHVDGHAMVAAKALGEADVVEVRVRGTDARMCSPLRPASSRQAAAVVERARRRRHSEARGVLDEMEVDQVAAQPMQPLGDARHSGAITQGAMRGRPRAVCACRAPRAGSRRSRSPASRGS